MAREFTNDLNEAYYLTHCVVAQHLSDRDAAERPLDVDAARALLREAARKLRNSDPLAA
jgi:hypothetical protein